jgi:metal-responsive CopG/Arc/MetJ family transcriptional regulator
MKAKISITLTEGLLKAIDRRAKQQGMTRSSVIEAAVRASLRQQTRSELNARDFDIINRRANFLNQEARDVLEYSQQ